MNEWLIMLYTAVGGVAVGFIWNISDKMDRIYKILKHGKDAE